MKCKICGHEISETDTVCPGCDTSIEELKQNNNIMSNEGVAPVASESVASEPVVTNVETPVAETPVVETPVVETPVENTTVETVPAETPVEAKEESVSETSAAPVEAPVENATAPVETQAVNNEEAAIYDGADVVIGAPLDSTVAVDAAQAEIKEETKKEKKKGGAGKVVLVIVILLVLAICGAGGYFFFVYGKPTAVLSRALNSTLAVTTTTDRYVDIKANVDANGNKYDVDSKVDLNNLISDTEIVLVSDTPKTVSILNDGVNAYVKYADLYTSSIKYDDALLNERLSYAGHVPYMTHMANVKNIISELKTVLPSVFDESKLTREFTTVTVDQKNMGATKFGYKLDQTDTNRLFLNIANEFKKNTAIMNNLMSIYSLSPAEVTELIDGYVKNLSVNGFEFNFYTDYLTNKYYMAEVIVKGVNNVKFTVNFDENNKISSLNIIYGSNQIDVTDNYRHIEILRTIDSKVNKYILDISYTVIPAIQVVAPEEFIEYSTIGKEAVEASIATDAALTTAYNLVVKDANIVYVAPELPETDETANEQDASTSETETTIDQTTGATEPSADTQTNTNSID